MKSLNEKELKDMYVEHQKWVDTLGSMGRRLNIDEIDLSKSIITSEIFEQGYLAGCKFDGRVFKEKSFYLTKLYSSSLNNCFFEEVDFTKADLSYSDFSNSKFMNVNFNKVECIESDFKNSIFHNINMVDVLFDNSDLRNSKFSNVDLSYSSFENVLVAGVSINRLRGIEKVNNISINIGDLDEPHFLIGEEAKKWLLNCSYTIGNAE